MASIGEREEARRAGKTPKITPIEEETKNEINTAAKLIEAGNQILIINTIPVAASNPATPPKTERIKLSERN